MTDATDSRQSAHVPGGAPAGTPARARSKSLLPDDERAGYLAQWEHVEAGFVADPEVAADGAARLVAELADGVVRRVEAIRTSVARAPEDDPPDGGSLERLRQDLIRCRIAFHALIDS